MKPSSEKGKVSRRIFLGTVAGAAAGLGFTGSSWANTQSALAQSDAARNELLRIFTEKKMALGGGILAMSMLDLERNPTIPLRSSFAFGPGFFLFHIESNPERFLLPTFEIGDLIIDPSSYTLTLSGSDTKANFGISNDGLPQVTLKGAGSCGVSGSSSHTQIGGSDLKEEVEFQATAVDGGSSSPGRFSVKVFVDKTRARTLHSIFGPEENFTGEIISGKVIVKEISRLPF